MLKNRLLHKQSRVRSFKSEAILQGVFAGAAAGVELF